MITPETSTIGPERLAAFSDGVIAIIITIMVLELHLPAHAGEGDAWGSFLLPLLPSLGIYALSFVIVGALWINHHGLIASVHVVTKRLLWTNLLLLFFMSLIPLATAFLGQHWLLPRAISFYAAIMCLSSAAFSILRIHLAHQVGSDRSGRALHPMTIKRSVLSTVLYGAAAGLAMFSAPAALALLALVPAMFNLTRLFEREG